MLEQQQQEEDVSSNHGANDHNIIVNTAPITAVVNQIGNRWRLLGSLHCRLKQQQPALLQQRLVRLFS